MSAALPRLIGIAGFAQSGKSTAAAHLAEHHGYVVASWADKLREAAMALDPIVGFEDGIGPVRYSEAIRRDGGYDEAKRSRFGGEFRRTLIRMGTEVGRDVFGADFWVDLLLGSLDPHERYVIPDTRFPNEADAIKATPGGVVIRIARHGVGAVVDHPSETALADWPYDAVIQNGGSVADLGFRLDAWLKLVAA